jgi:serine protease inhibitor
MHELAIRLLQNLNKSVVSPLSILELLHLIFTKHLGCHSIAKLIGTTPTSFTFYATLLNLKGIEGVELDTSLFTDPHAIESIRNTLVKDSTTLDPVEKSNKKKLIVSISSFTPTWKIAPTHGGYYRKFHVDIRNTINIDMMGMTSRHVQSSSTSIYQATILPINKELRLVLIMPTKPIIFDFIKSLGPEALDIMANVEETSHTTTVLFPCFEFESSHTDLSAFLYDKKKGLDIGSPVDTQILYGTKIKTTPTHPSHSKVPFDAVVYDHPFVYFVQHKSAEILWMGSVVRPSGYDV